MDDGAVIVDCGSYCCRIGFGGEDAPCGVVRTQHALETIGIRPGVFSPGNVQTCEDLWEYLFREQLHVSSRDYSVLVTEPACRPRQERESWSEVCKMC